MVIVDPAPPSNEEVASPCIGVCTVDPSKRLCSGCMRTMDEIGGWLTYSADQKKAVLKKIQQRFSKQDAAG